MSWLMRVIGLVLGTTQTVTLACQTQDGQNGGNSNTAEQPKSVNKELKRKPSRAKVATKVQLSKTETSCVPTSIKKSSTNGTQSATPASQHANKSRKHKSLVVQSTSQDKSRKPEQKLAQTTNGKRGRPRKTVV